MFLSQENMIVDRQITDGRLHETFPPFSQPKSPPDLLSLILHLLLTSLFLCLFTGEVAIQEIPQSPFQPHGG